MDASFLSWLQLINHAHWLPWTNFSCGRSVWYRENIFMGGSLSTFTLTTPGPGNLSVSQAPVTGTMKWGPTLCQWLCLSRKHTHAHTPWQALRVHSNLIPTHPSPTHQTWRTPPLPSPTLNRWVDWNSGQPAGPSSHLHPRRNPHPECWISEVLGKSQGWDTHRLDLKKTQRPKNYRM